MNKSYLVYNYRWGYLNNHSYLIGVYDDLEKAIEQAKKGNEYRGGKYGTCVWEIEKDFEVDENCNTHGLLVKYFPSIYDEEKPSFNENNSFIDMLGKKIFTKLKDNKKIDITEILEMYNEFNEILNDEKYKKIYTIDVQEPQIIGNI